MTNRISPREWEALSAFLDNQLSPKEHTRLSERLKADANLRQALEELRRTRIILRGQRPLRAPRNFTLTPAMAGRRRGAAGAAPGPFTVLRLASIMATIFFVLITVSDLAVQQFGPQPRTVTLEEQMQRGIIGMGGGGGGPGLPPMEVTAEAQLEEPAAAESEAGASTAASAVAPDTLAVEVTPVGTLAPNDAATDMAFKQPGDQPPALVQPATEPEGQPQEGVTPQTQAVRPPGVTLLIRLLQGLLIVLAVGAGLAAYYLRRTTG
jgi:anti-sigma factor RsiW